MSDLAHARGPASRIDGRPSFGTRLSFGLGSVATGVKDNGFNYFLLIFYSQVIGVDARLVGVAMTLSLVLDAITDPLVGYWSDNFRSRWGRRHPFMYVALIPVSVGFLLLWNPPTGWSEQQLFWWVLGLSVVVRTFINLFETPSSALGPELSRNYDERSTLLSWRFYFGWTGGNAMSVLNFMVLFPLFATAAIPNGQFNREAYQVYGVVGAVLIFASILICALGTQAQVLKMPPPPQPRRRIGPVTIFKEIFETLADRSFVALFVGFGLGAIATGLSAALAFYFSAYFWGFSPQQIGLITFSVFVSAVIGAWLAPWATRTMGKKRAAIIIGLVAFLGSPLPITLRLAGLLPANGDPSLFWFYLIANTIDVGLIICFQILQSSMLSDLVEQSQLKTGRRSEGVFFSAVTFIRFSVQGLGVIAAGTVLALADFPKGATPGEVGPDALWRLGAYYVPTILACWLGMVAVMSTYRLTRDDHEANLRQLAEIEAAQETASPQANPLRDR